MSETIFPTSPVLPAEPLSALLRTSTRDLTGGQAGQSPEKAAKDFESILLYRLLEEMKQTIPDSGLLQTGISKQVQDIFWYYLAQQIADQGGLGLWKQFHGQLFGPESAQPGRELKP